MFLEIPAVTFINNKKTLGKTNSLFYTKKEINTCLLSCDQCIYIKFQTQTFIMEKNINELLLVSTGRNVVHSILQMYLGLNRKTQFVPELC